MATNIEKLAAIIVDYSTKVKPGDRVRIVCEGLEGLPLVKALYRQCIVRKARHVEYDLREPSITRDFLSLADNSQLSFIPPEYFSIIKQTDVYIWIGAQSNTRELALIDGKRIALHKNALAPLREERLKNTRWCALLYPSIGLAQDANMSLDDFTDLFFKACLRDWEKEKKKMLPLKKLLDSCSRVTITGKGTDLTFTVSKRKSVLCAGEVNLPDGEIFIAPDRTSVEGAILFNLPAEYQGRLFYDVKLTFEKGKVVKESARNDIRELKNILDTDKGSRYLGEFALGLNRRIKRQFFNPLFDEKIYGTIHLALGHCYPQSDNGNKSAIHWDLIYSLKNGGKLVIDDKVVVENGNFADIASWRIK